MTAARRPAAHLAAMHAQQLRCEIMRTRCELMHQHIFELRARMAAHAAERARLQ